MTAQNTIVTVTNTAIQMISILTPVPTTVMATPIPAATMVFGAVVYTVGRRCRQRRFRQRLRQFRIATYATVVTVFDPVVHIVVG